MIKTLHDKFDGMTIDIKVILKEKEVLCYIIPAFEDKKNLEPMMFRGTPEDIDEQIKTALNGIEDTDIAIISNFSKLVESIAKAKKEKATNKSAPKKKDAPAKSTPSLF